MKGTILVFVAAIALSLQYLAFAQDTAADDANTAMTLEATDAVIAPDDSPADPDVAGDASYTSLPGLLRQNSRRRVAITRGQSV